MSLKAIDKGYNCFGSIDDLDLTTEQKEQVLEYLAQKYWDVLQKVGIQDGHCKSYDPLVIEGNTAHTYVFDLNDGGRHHAFKDYADLEQQLHDDFVRNLKGENLLSELNELKAKNL